MHITAFWIVENLNRYSEPKYCRPKTTNKVGKCFWMSIMPKEFRDVYYTN